MTEFRPVENHPDPTPLTVDALARLVRRLLRLRAALVSGRRLTGRRARLVAGLVAALEAEVENERRLPRVPRRKPGRPPALAVLRERWRRGDFREGDGRS